MKKVCNSGCIYYEKVKSNGDDGYGNCELMGAYCRKHNKVMNVYHYHHGHCDDYEVKQ